MNRTSLLSLFVVAGATAVLLAGNAQSQSGVPKNQVILQPATPGTSQSGHLNVSGTARAGQFVGGGAGVTNVNAAQLGGLAANQYGVVNNNNSWIGLNTFSSAGNSFTGNGAGLSNVNATLLDGIDSTAFLQAVPNPLVLTGSTPAGIIQVTNSSSSSFSVGIISTLSNPVSGLVSAAIKGEVSSIGSGSYGVYGVHNGSGTGVYGTSVHQYGVYGQSDNSYGGRFASLNSNGLIGITTSSTPGMRGVEGHSSSTNGAGVYGFANASGGIGVLAEHQFGGLSLLARTTAEFQGNVSIGAGSSPIVPLDFSETLGDKISLWGSSPSSHYGFGVQGGQLQIFASSFTDAISFGFGGSTSFSEVFRMANQFADFRFRPGGADNSSRITTPYDFLIEHDFDNDSTDSWIRTFTNNLIIEQFRIEDGDEAAARFDGTVNANGIDFAEGFKIMDSDIEAGDLVVNTSSNWEYVSKSSQPYQQGVIGVVSTRPAFVAGMSFDAEDRMDPELTKRRDEARLKGDMALEKALTKQMRALVEEAYRPIAFVGRVPVKVTGTVRAGDHLTASHIPGVAMAMTSAGHSIGIALEASNGANDKVMVMIQPKHYSGPITIPNRGLDNELSSLKSEMAKLRAENTELRDRLDRLEQLLRSNKR